MALPFDATNPANTQGAKLGALRMREMKSILNGTVGLQYSLSTADSTSATVSAIPNCISGVMLKSHASDDGQRAVDSDHIVTGAVTADKIEAGGVETASIDDLAVTTAKIADLNVTTGKLAADAVTTAKITDLNVTTGKLALESVTQITIGDAEVTPEKLIRPRKWIRLSEGDANGTAGAPVTAIARASNVITVTWAAHPFKVGDSFVIGGATPDTFDGTHTISAVGLNSFTMDQAGANASLTSGGESVGILGSSFSLTGAAVAVTLSGAGSVVTGTTSGAHGLLTGDRVRISGSTTDGFNGEFVITIGSATTFTYAATTAVTTALGTTKVQELARDFSVARVSTGRFTLTFTSAMPDLCYSAFANTDDPGGGAARAAYVTSLLAASLVVQQRNGSGTAVEDVPMTVFVVS
jgi:hypothetical protein